MKVRGAAVVPLHFLDFHPMLFPDGTDFFQALIEVLLPNAAQHEKGFRLLCPGSPVFPLHTVNTLERNAGFQHGCRRRQLCHHLFDHRCEEPHVSKQHIYGKAHVRHVGFKGRLRLRIELCLVDFCAVRFRDEAAQPHHR